MDVAEEDVQENGFKELFLRTGPCEWLIEGVESQEQDLSRNKVLIYMGLMFV
jgi:hypothetical protein